MLKVTFLLFVLLSAGMIALDSQLKTEVTPLGMISYEFIKTNADLELAFKAWGLKGMIIAALLLGLDFLFLVLYALIMVLLASHLLRKINDNGSKYTKHALLVVMFGFPVVALLDVFENLALGQLLIGHRNEWLTLSAYYLAALKFALAGLLLAAFAITFGLIKYKAHLNRI